MSDPVQDQLERYFPRNLVRKLLQHYSRLKNNYIYGNHEPGELNGAKFAEVVFRLLQCATDPNNEFTPLSRRLPRTDNLVETLEQTSSNHDDSIRLHIPRLLKSIYGIRNKRGVGHTGEIDASLLDATIVMSVCDWVMAELIRLYHDCSADEAQAIVDRLVKRAVPFIYDRDGIKKVLKKDSSCEDQVLLLLYHENEKDVLIGELCKWVEYSHVTRFKDKILRPLHGEKKLHLDVNRRTTRILPPGMKHVEEEILLHA